MISLNLKNSQIIKEFRVTHNVKAKDIAIELGVSSAYISKLEKGDYKSINEDVLLKMIQYISNDEKQQQEVFDAIKGLSEEQTLMEQIKSKVSDIELYIQDFKKMIKSMEDSISISEQMQTMFKKNAEEKLLEHKEELYNMIEQLTVETN